MQSIFVQYLTWHFFEAPKRLLGIIWNFLRFVFNYFSVALLLKTFFSHWRRYRDFYPRAFEPKTILYVFVSNMISRIIGVIARTITLAVFLALESAVFVLSALIFLGWILLPFVILALLYSGAQLLYV